MSRRPLKVAAVAPALCALVALALLGALGATLARGERTQQGNLIVSLNGSMSPLELPRHRAAPISVHLEGGLESADGGPVPRVIQMELGLPGRGTLETRGLPVCSLGKLHEAPSETALELCGDALVGDGKLTATLQLPSQEPFDIDVELLIFNGRVDGRPALLVHGYTPNPPGAAVIPFFIERDSGRFETVMRANLPAAIGPWPHLASFEMTLSRHYTYRGKSRSVLSATCPVPPSFTAGFFSFAHARFTLDNGEAMATNIARSCRAPARSP